MFNLSFLHRLHFSIVPFMDSYCFFLYQFIFLGLEIYTVFATSIFLLFRFYLHLFSVDDLIYLHKLSVYNFKIM